jgi:hypothetical protein
VVTSFEPTCQPADPVRPDTFPPCDVGSGAFGRWVTDEHGLPAFLYTADQQTDARALWVTTDFKERTDHLFQIGNDRLIAVLSNDGFVQIFNRDRLPTFLNRVNLNKGYAGGGYSYVAEAGAAWATAYRLRPEGAVAERLYGMNHARFTTGWNGLSVTHEIVAPPGDRTFVLDDVTVRNDSDRPRRFAHFEFWDVNRHSLELQLIRSGDFTPDIPDAMDEQREAINGAFILTASPDGPAVRIAHTYRTIPEEPENAPSERDFYPHDIFLARLTPSTDETPLSMHTDRRAFFGDGRLERPHAATQSSVPTPLIGPVNAEGQPAVLADRLLVTLEPGEEARFRYAYGYVPTDEPLPDLSAYEWVRNRPSEDLAKELKKTLPLFVCDEAPFLHREAAWHAVQLYGAAVYDGYMETHTVVQGSAYMYLHGLDGAGRDYALFSLPLSYLRPELARDLLRMIMRMTYADTDQISYAIQGHGVVEDAVIHRAPSDLDLFFLWALAEYVAVTGDRAFLDEQNFFWPKDTGETGTVREHAARAFYHLRDQVGTGGHGLIRVRTGDWSDSIVAEEAPNPSVAEEEGESVPNTQMAVWVLPRAAGLFEHHDPNLASEIRAFAQLMRTEAAEEWVEQWYRRAWFSQDEPFGEGHLNLESQIWALIADIPDPDRRADAIHERLDNPSAVGARRVEGGLVWHAVTGLLTWGYLTADPELAWGSLIRHTLNAYATANPDQWYGTWSGPDGIGVNGGTWSSAATPTKDWPVMNANQHAMPLLALFRVCGLCPSPEGDGLVIHPRVPGRPFTLDLPVLKLSVSPGRIAGTYRAQTEGHTTLYIAKPGDQVTVRLNGYPVAPLMDETFVVLPLVFQTGDRISFEVVTSGS